MIYRKYNPKKDKDALYRISKEICWPTEGIETFVDEGRNIVVEVNGEIEAFASSSLGKMQYLNGGDDKDKIPFSNIGTVATSLIMRKQGIAGKITALKIAEDVEDGAAICALDMFDQGYYDKLGFGTGSYTNYITFPLKALKITGKPKIPTRLTKKDWKVVNESMHNRLSYHGTFCASPDLIKGSMEISGIGYGYFDENNNLTHHIWINDKKLDAGKASIKWMTYQNYDQFFELLRLLKSFQEQITTVYMRELPNINIQDLLETPFHYQALSENTPHEFKTLSEASWQMRICDIKKVLSLTKLNFGNIKFNLKLKDPIEKYLVDEDVKWKGISGNYIVELGENSSAVDGNDAKLETMEASVGAFSRMWLGVKSATSLSLTDDLKASEELIKTLDKVLCLPLPYPNHPF